MNLQKPKSLSNSKAWTINYLQHISLQTPQSSNKKKKYIFFSNKCTDFNHSKYSVDVLWSQLFHSPLIITLE